MLLPFKIAKTHPRYLNADVLVLSIGKSGRTWLRVLVNKYLSLKSQVPFDLKDLSRHVPSLPSIIYAHELWMHYSEASFTQQLKMKHIIPDRVLRKKKIVLLVRDPRDVVVSLYFQVTKRSDKKHRQVDLPIGEFIKHPRYGVENIVRTLNKWHERLAAHPDLMLLRYEDIKANTEGELKRFLQFCDLEDIDDSLISEAVEFSRFENMKKMEAKGAFIDKALTPGDSKDPNSFKVREGKVGGYAQHFTEDELRYLDNAVGRLDTYFGYTTVSRRASGR